MCLALSLLGRTDVTHAASFDSACDHNILQAYFTCALLDFSVIVIPCVQLKEVQGTLEMVQNQRNDLRQEVKDLKAALAEAQAALEVSCRLQVVTEAVTHWPLGLYPVCQQFLIQVLVILHRLCCDRESQVGPSLSVHVGWTCTAAVHIIKASSCCYACRLLLQTVSSS